MTDRDDDHDRDDRFLLYYQKYYRRVVRYYVRAFRLSEEDAEELAQDAFIRFLESMDEYRADAEWAFFETIAYRVALNRIRACKTQKRHAHMVAIDAPELTRREPAAPEGPDYAEQEQLAIRRKRVYDEIASLSRSQRECLHLWLDGFQYEEIARVLHVTVDAVKSRLRDAKKILRERLGADELPEGDHDQ